MFDMGLSIVAVIVLGIVVDDTIHFISKYLKAKKMGKTPTESVYQIYHDVGSAIIFTSVILIIAFGIMIFASFLYNVKFGFFTAFTVLMALVFDLLFLPAFFLMGEKKSTIQAEKESVRQLYAHEWIEDMGSNTPGSESVCSRVILSI